MLARDSFDRHSQQTLWQTPSKGSYHRFSQQQTLSNTLFPTDSFQYTFSNRLFPTNYFVSLHLHTLSSYLIFLVLLFANCKVKQGGRGTSRKKPSDENNSGLDDWVLCTVLNGFNGFNSDSHFTNFSTIFDSQEKTITLVEYSCFCDNIFLHFSYFTLSGIPGVLCSWIRSATVHHFTVH